jgi:hypothetical protein
MYIAVAQQRLYEVAVATPKNTNNHLYCRNLDRRHNVIVCLGGFGANRLHTKICVYVAL